MLIRPLKQHKKIAPVFNIGRPKKIQLLVLIDRGHKQLPIQADYVGKNIPTSLKEIVELKVSEVDGEDAVNLKEEN